MAQVQSDFRENIDAMTEELDFSIVTPSYNYSQYIREMLDSVVAQTDVTFEHIIYDAGSTDGTLDIIREYDHVDLTVEPDNGMTDAINKGFRRARGKWVMWLNTDDRLKPGALAAVKSFAEMNPDTDVLYGAWDFIDANGDYQRTMQVFPFQKLMLSQLGCYIGSTSTFLRKKTILDEGILLNDRFKYVMDGEYYNRLAGLGKTFRSFPKILADFRMHGANISQKHLKQKEINGVLDQQLQFAESRAIRRVYGVTLFENDHLNSTVDCLFAYWFRVNKLLLKMLYRSSKVEGQ